MNAMSSALRLTGQLNPREGWKAERCTIARALEVVSTRSAVLIMREAFYGTTRFDDFADRGSERGGKAAHGCPGAHRAVPALGREGGQDHAQ